jgi:hypothetical protein
MERRPPTPLCTCFLLCRQIFIDLTRKDYVLVSPVHQVFPARYPAEEDLSVFARWTNAHGAYTVEVRLRTLEGDVLWTAKMTRPFETQDPLQVWILPLPHFLIPFPQPGKYEVALFAEGQEVAADVITAHPARPGDEG